MESSPLTPQGPAFRIVRLLGQERFLAPPPLSSFHETSQRPLFQPSFETSVRLVSPFLSGVKAPAFPSPQKNHLTSPQGSSFWCGLPLSFNFDSQSPKDLVVVPVKSSYAPEQSFRCRRVTCAFTFLLQGANFSQRPPRALSSSLYV